ncbi:MAG: 1-(5-phosphoribosyl)-5-[(5-phosphoribosylamino)methylideneamino]imidazole-4-carboxamide isomerase [Deltaproteobacteria bacterium]|uniref:1-(5-phosphoribosyl)-5-[(5-phosphoribosylamino)methylideneamino] imidazole-4-carboxamide isomerase n=1 Tax=Candidatus Zymogenus saltonus TaxID=2844893 RepID=A0A9D8KDX3_9DELT|nr:1-(5-phosphoribosyl)-5-[(5-phosphoribosylamino)methylideneamino]imidazole-4-carboxamide isomerase [Candidatus Zymogenus saltonus]
MVVIPAVDMMGGRAVRLSQGDFNKETRYFEDSFDAARNWVECGAKRLHLVDLDAAKKGAPAHMDTVARIVRELRVPVEIGGGIRSMDIVEKYLGIGVGWVIVGTAAVDDRDFVLTAASRFPDRIILGIDARDGLVKTKGWTEGTALTAVELARSYINTGIAAVIYTDIAKDGVGGGVDIEGTRRLAVDGKIPTIASGGIKYIDDIRAVIPLEKDGVIGVIAGRSLYEGTLDLAEAIREADGKKATAGG